MYAVPRKSINCVAFTLSSHRSIVECEIKSGKAGKKERKSDKEKNVVHIFVFDFPMRGAININNRTGMQVICKCAFVRCSSKSMEYYRFRLCRTPLNYKFREIVDCALLLFLNFLFRCKCISKHSANVYLFFAQSNPI